MVLLANLVFKEKIPNLLNICFLNFFKSILIGNNNMLKISDFGHCKNACEKSMVMSFKGTVAWMAPEVIRNEACSEKVDIYAYGVVAWECLTCEVPYKNLDQNSIMWGVGSNKLRLPIPSSAPDGMKILLEQCLSIKPRNRPTFSQIIKHLEVLSNTESLFKIEDEYLKIQLKWKDEIETKLNSKRNDTKLKSNVAAYNFNDHNNDENHLVQKRKEELRHATEIRELYEQKLEKANNLFIELNTVMLQLDEREREVNRREKALNIQHKKIVRTVIKREFRNNNSGGENAAKNSKNITSVKNEAKRESQTHVQNNNYNNSSPKNISNDNSIFNFDPTTTTILETFLSNTQKNSTTNIKKQQQNDKIKYKKLMLFYERNKYDFLFIKKKQLLRMRYLCMSSKFKSKFHCVLDSSFRHAIDFNSQEIINRVFDEKEQIKCGDIRVARKHEVSKLKRTSTYFDVHSRKLKQRMLDICFLTDFQVKFFLI
jgi:serine/threonine protein kinase